MHGNISSLNLFPNSHYKKIDKFLLLILAIYGGLNRLKRRVGTDVVLLPKRISPCCVATISKPFISTIVLNCGRSETDVNYKLRREFQFEFYKLLKQLITLKKILFCIT